MNINCNSLDNEIHLNILQNNGNNKKRRNSLSLDANGKQLCLFSIKAKPSFHFNDFDSKIIIKIFNQLQLTDQTFFTLKLVCRKWHKSADFLQLKVLFYQVMPEPALYATALNFPPIENRLNIFFKVACQASNLAMIDCIQNHQASDKKIDIDKAFLWACKHGHLEVVQHLLRNKYISFSSQNCQVVFKAAKNDHPELVLELLNNPFLDPSINDNYLIKWACKRGHLEIVKRLLTDVRIDPSVENKPFLKALDGGHTEILMELVQDIRVDPSIKNNFLIKWASEYGHVELVEILLKDPRVDPSADNNKAIRLATYNLHDNVVKVLSEHSFVQSQIGVVTFGLGLFPDIKISGVHIREDQIVGFEYKV